MGEIRMRWWEEAGHEGEERDVAFVADVGGFFVVVNGGVAVGFVFGGPVQVVEIAEEGGVVGIEVRGVVVFVEDGGEGDESTLHHADPGDEIEV